MGNALNKMCFCCIGRYRRRKYLRTRYTIEKDISIEFENLIDEEETQQEELESAISQTERLLLLKKGYGVLIEEQKRIDEEIAAQLVRQEEELRQEEEAYYESCRQAAQEAVKRKQNIPKQTTGRKQDGRSSGDDVTNQEINAACENNDEEWELTGFDEDFETFLDAVKARSLAARTRSLPSQVPSDEQSSSSKDRTDEGNSSLDLEWEHEAGMPPIPKHKKRSIEDPTASPSNKPSSTNKNPLISAEESRALSELAIRPNLLALKDTTGNPEFEWNSDIESEMVEEDLNSDGTSNSESKTLLASSTDAPIR